MKASVCRHREFDVSTGGTTGNGHSAGLDTTRRDECLEAYTIVHQVRKLRENGKRLQRRLTLLETALRDSNRGSSVDCLSGYLAKGT